MLLFKLARKANAGKELPRIAEVGQQFVRSEPA